MGSSSKNKKQAPAGPPGGAPGRVGGSMPVQMGWKLDANGNPLPQDQQPMQDMPFAQPDVDPQAKMRAMLAQQMMQQAQQRSDMMAVGGRGARGMGGAFGNGFGGGRGGNTPGGGYGGGKRGGGLY